MYQRNARNVAAMLFVNRSHRGRVCLAHRCQDRSEGNGGHGPPCGTTSSLRVHVLRGEAMNMPLVPCDKCRTCSEFEVSRVKWEETDVGSFGYGLAWRNMRRGSSQRCLMQTQQSPWHLTIHRQPTVTVVAHDERRLQICGSWGLL